MRTILGTQDLGTRKHVGISLDDDQTWLWLVGQVWKKVQVSNPIENERFALCLKQIYDEEYFLN